MRFNRRKKIVFAAFTGVGTILFASIGASTCNADSTSATGEEYPGGKATSRGSVNNRNAFSHSSGNLNPRGEFRFKIGNAIFRKKWVSSPSSTKSSDGLGPLFNARSCQQCHIKDGRGHPPTSPQDNATSMVVRLSVVGKHAGKDAVASNAQPHSVYGSQLQEFAVQGLQREGKPTIKYLPVRVTYPDRMTVTLRRPIVTITNLSHGPLGDGARLSVRMAQPMIGLGLLDAVSQQEIMKLADPDDRDGDGVSGRPNRVWSIEQQRTVLGKFGWKAGQPTVRQQSADAFANDIGISTSLLRKPWGECTARQILCRNAPHGETQKQGSTSRGTEISDKLFDLVVFYASNLAVPKRQNMHNTDVVRGKSLFAKTGCTKCHRPSMTTANSVENPHLSNQTIWPYTDLLLHDMGVGLADHRPEARATGHEWRTPPLWGIGQTQFVNGHTFFLHDGRARDIEEAILWHAGEAKASRDAFMALSKKERDQLIAFVNSL